jgi:signal peptidase I
VSARRGFVVLACVAALLAVRALAAEPFAIPSGSMAPTLRPGDHVLVDKIAYRLGPPARGDLVALASPVDDAPLLKRVAAVGGDRVELRDGVLHVNGRPRAEPYVDLGAVDGVYFGPVRVPPGHVFVLGDNRGDSDDSRDFGAVAERALIGRVGLRFWPPRALARF